MTVLIQYAQALVATLKRDASVYFSYRFRFASQAAGMLLTLTIFHFVSKLVRPDAVGPHGTYFAFVVVGIVTMSVITAAVNQSQVLRMELVAGNFERLVISPLGPVGGAISLALFPILYSAFFAGAMLALAAGLFGVPVHVGGIPLALLVVALTAVAFAAIGLVFVGGLIAYKSAMGPMWVLAGLGLLAGIYFPVKLFPEWIRWASDVQPLTPAVDLLRHLLVGTASVGPVWLNLVKVAGFAAVLMPLAGVLLWQAIKISRRRGTLMEY